MLRAVVFDLDDTLYPERAYVDSGFRAVAAWAERRLGVPAARCHEELEELFERGDRRRTFDRWLAGHSNGGTDLVAEMVSVYRAHEPRIRPFQGVEPLLDRLGVGHRLGLLTDGDGGVQRKKLAGLGLTARFDEVLFTDDLGRDAWKPSPRPFRLLLHRLGLDGPEAVYVADNPTKDFAGARVAGLWTVRARFPGGLYGALEPPSPAHEPLVEVRDLAALEVALADITGRVGRPHREGMRQG